MPDNSSRYNVGGLEIELGGSTSSAESAFNEIQTLTRRINSLRKALLAFETINTSGALSNLQNVFTGLSSLTNRRGTNAVQTLTSVTKALSSLNKIGSLEKINFGKIGDGFATLTKKIEPFINKVKEAEASLTALSSIMKGSGSAKSALNLGATQSGGLFSLKNLFSIGKLAVAFRWVKRIGSAVAQIAQSGSDYLETLNMWAVSMRKNLDLGEQFVNKISKAYGISEKTVMNAQATFKNMVGSLGQISEETAYTISEAVTQMAIDYSSLYNVEIKSAFTKFQAALAGQVRPIRSVSGYDITETTLYQLYQSIGGEKTMRQLNRTEKQLLSLLAIYEQMWASGAVGDMAKTLNLFANQSRIMTEQWDRIKTYSGILVRNFIDSNKILIYINAGLIFASELLKAIAGYQSDIKGEQFVDPFAGTEEGAENANDAVEKLKKNLLGFDKIRALSSTDESALSIDEVLIEKLKKYESILDGVTNEAQDLANKWLTNLGLVDENNDGVLDMNQSLKDLLSTIKSISYTLGVIAIAVLANKITSFTSLIGKGELAIKSFSATANVAFVAGLYLIIDSIIKLVDNWNDMSDGAKVARFALITAGAALLTYSIASKIAAASAKESTRAMLLQKAAAIGLAVGGIALLVANIALLATNWDKLKTWEKVIGIFGAIGAAALAAAAAIAAFHGSWTMGTAVFAIVGGLAAIAGAFVAFKGSMKDLSIPGFAEGGVLPDKGTLFLAGEAGAEIVYNTGNGGNGGVANVQQIAQANYQGTMAALNDWWGGRNAKGDIPQLTEANATGMYQAVTGVARSYGKKWSNA